MQPLALCFSQKKRKKEISLHVELHVSSNSIRKEEFVESMLVMLLPCPPLNPATIFLW